MVITGIVAGVFLAWYPFHLHEALKLFIIAHKRLRARLHGNFEGRHQRRI